jgi:hypothetical protein
MKKITLSVLLALLALGVFTGAAGAQTTGPGYGLLHDYMAAALADALDLSVDEVEARLTAGETMYAIALAEGVAEDDIPALLADVRTAAVNAAVADGVITQAQADRMLARMARQGYGSGTCTMGGTRPQDGTGFGFGRGMGMHRGGFWQNNNP